MARDSSDLALLTFVQERRNLIALACSVVRNESIAEELVQDSWLRWQGQEYPARKAVPILRRIVANLAKDWYRRQATERAVLAEHAATLDFAVDSERIAIARQDLIRVVRALKALPKRTRTAFELHCLDGLSYARIGSRLGLSRSRAFELVTDALVHLTLALEN
ncbi:MAG: sigma-70 family RNA polymerase sigma factor [Pseudomonadota bacterium]